MWYTYILLGSKGMETTHFPFCSEKVCSSSSKNEAEAIKKRPKTHGLLYFVGRLLVWSHYLSGTATTASMESSLFPLLLLAVLAFFLLSIFGT